MIEKHNLHHFTLELVRSMRPLAVKTLIVFIFKGDWRQAHASDINGLVQGHAYTITGIYRVHVDNNLCYLVRIRNPWGDNNEWKGKVTYT